MAKLPVLHRDPTLEAVDAAIEAAQDRRPRPYLGMSAIGGPCERQLWYGFRWATPIAFDAATLKRFSDGHAGEDLQAARLRMVKGIELHTHDETGRQFGFVDLGGHFKGHMDGAIRGLLQAPRTWAVWEHKSVDDPKYRKLEKAIEAHGIKGALAAWDETYFVQAMLYCHYAGLTRHYLTCSTPGGRRTIAVRTDYHAPTALRAIERARRIIAAAEPPARISEDPDHWQCRWCPHRAICHEKRAPLVSCRTCLHATPETDGEDGRWSCALHGADIPSHIERNGCEGHRFIPALLPWRAVDASPEENWIAYEGGIKNGGDGMTSEEIREVVNAGDHA